MVLPTYLISPEEIFKGEVWILNPDFFSPEETKINSSTDINEISLQEIYASEVRGFPDTSTESANAFVRDILNRYDYSGNIDISSTIALHINEQKNLGPWQSTDSDGNETSYLAKIYVDSIVNVDPNTAETTWSSNVQVKVYKGEIRQTIGYQLKSVIAKWYYTIRNFAIVVMMIILVYVGIRILLCSVSSEKAKYKNMLKDWVVALALIFVMHYIMVFAMNINKSIINLVSSIVDENEYLVVIDDGSGNGKVYNALVANGIDPTDLIETVEGRSCIKWDARNFMGLFRMQAALVESETNLYIAYVIAFIVLVMYTIFFIFTYMKRVLYLAFLTIIAPFVAMTYPIDKIGDGKAQAFNMWFKEYIFNLLIQPMHLILYTILIGGAFELATENPIYALVAIGFMMPAEKLVRRFFGFDKAQTPGMLGGAVGAGMVMSGMNKLLHGRPPKPGDGENSKIKTEKDETERIPNVKDTDDSTMIDGISADVPALGDNKLDNPSGDTESEYGAGGDSGEGKPPKDYSHVFEDEANNSAIPPDVNPENNIDMADLDNINEDTDPISLLNQKDKDEYERLSYHSDINSIGSDVYKRRKELAEKANQEKANRLKIKQTRQAQMAEQERKKQEQEKKDKAQRAKEEREANERLAKAREAKTLGGKIKKIKNNVSLDGLKAEGKEYAAQKLSRPLNNIRSGKTFKNAGRKVTGVALGAGAGIVGLAAGIASGDPSKALSYAGAGAATGYAVGAKRNPSNIDEEALKREYDKAKYGSVEEYQKAKVEERREKYISDSKNIKALQERLKLNSYKEAEEKLIKYSDCVDSGITDIDDIAAVIKTVEEKGWTKQKAKTVAKTYSKIGGKTSNQMDEDEKRNSNFKIKNIVKSQGITVEKQADEAAKQIRTNLDIFGSYKNKFNEIQLK